MRRTAKVVTADRGKAVRLQKEFPFETHEVWIHKLGEDVTPSSRSTDWSEYLRSGPVASSDFMEEVEDLPVQCRR